MTWIIDTTAKRRLSAKLAAGIAISAILTIGSFTGSANAREYHHDWNGGYYHAPPIVYGSTYGSSYYGYSPYYSPPPAVYGPGVGISLPFVNLNIR